MALLCTATAVPYVARRAAHHGSQSTRSRDVAGRCHPVGHACSPQAWTSHFHPWNPCQSCPGLAAILCQHHPEPLKICRCVIERARKTLVCLKVQGLSFTLCRATCRILLPRGTWSFLVMPGLPFAIWRVSLDSFIYLHHGTTLDGSKPKACHCSSLVLN